MISLNSFKKELRLTLALSAPVSLTQLGMMAMGLVDTIMVGPLGSESLAATSVGNSVFFAALVLAMGIVLALDPLLAQAVGAGEHKQATEALWQGGWLALLLSIPLTLLFLDSRWLFVLLRQPEQVSLLAGNYLAGRAFSVLPFLAFGAMRSFLNGHGETRPVMWIALGANGVNAFADWVLINGHLGFPSLGVLGAGLATSIVRWVMLAAVIALLLRARYKQPLRSPAWPNPRALWRLFRVGTPIGGQLLIEVGLFATVSVLAGWFGARAQAAHQIALSLASITFMVPLGISMGATIRVGQAVGAGDLDAAAFSGKVSIGLGALVMGSSSLIFLAFPRALASIFSPEPQVAQVAVGLIGVAALFQVFDGIQVVATGCLRGAGDTRTPFVANGISHWLLGVPLSWALAFPLGFGVRGLWWGITASLTVVALLEAWLFFRGGWRKLARL